ncbi:MAG: lysine exporter LysO family protein [Bacillota bacterium]|jgi:uncharacterized membrane protein YbjE (DUF340 family)
MTGMMIILAVGSGLLLGRFWLTPDHADVFTRVSPWALNLLLFGIGFELADDRKVWRKMLAMGWRVFLVPLTGALGSLLGALLAGLLLSLGTWEALSVGAGFGWYSLSGVLLNNLGFTTLAAIAFLSNVLREVLAMLSIPWLAKRLDPIAAIAPGGATTMDTTLPIISRCGTSTATLIALVNGLVLSGLVPLLVPLFAGLI